MKLGLKNLKETKGNKKEYKFLKSVSELIIDEYEDILSEFTIENFKEAIEEIVKKHSFIAVYEDTETIYTKYVNDFFYSDIITEKYKKEEGLSISKVLINISSLSADLSYTFARNSGRWGSTRKVKLEELYVVVDNKGFEDFVIESLIKQEKASIERAKKVTESSKKDVAIVAKRAGLFGKDYKTRNNSEAAAKLVELIEETDKKKQFELASDLICEIAEIADDDSW